MASALAYDDLVVFIAGANPAAVTAFRPSEVAARLEALLEREGALFADRRELEQDLQLEHVMRLAKAKARLLLGE